MTPKPRKPRVAKARPPPIQEDMFQTNDETAILRMELSGMKDKLDIMQDQFDQMKRLYLEIKQANEFYRKELGL